MTIAIEINVRSLQPSSFIIISWQWTSELRHQTFLARCIVDIIKFSPHINNILVKASKILQWNLSKCSEEVKSACLGLVYPILEYSSSVWDPLLTYWYPIHWKSPKKCSPMVSSDYSRFNSVTSTYVKWTAMVNLKNLLDCQSSTGSFIIYQCQHHPSLTTLIYSN